jgi:biotin carboxylase
MIEDDLFNASETGPGRQQTNLTTLLVVYDRGSLSPLRITELAREIDCRVVFLCPSSTHNAQMIPVLEALAPVIEADPQDLGHVVRQASRFDPAGIVTFSEPQLTLTAHVATRLGLSHHGLDILPAIVEKDRQRLKLGEAGLDHVAFAVVSDPSDVDDALAKLTPPVIIKPRIGAGSRDTMRVETTAECRTEVTKLLSKNARTATDGDSALILEEALEGRPCDWRWGDYIAVDSLATPDGVYPLFVTGKVALASPFRERGCFTPPRESPSDVQEVRDVAAQAVRAIGITTGIADVEIKLTADGPKVIELNGRLGAWVDDVVVRSGGTSPGRLAMMCAAGLPIDIASLESPEVIAFHYLIVPPLAASTVEAIHNPEQLRRLPNVERVAVLARPGGDVRWTLGVDSTVASVTGVVSSYDELQETLDAIEETDWISYA